MLTRLLHGGLPAAAAVAFAAAPSMACAAGAPGSLGAPSAASILPAVTPGWRITQFLPHADANGLSAVGARDAWLAGEACGANSLCDHLFVRHGDGTVWRTVAPPKGISGTIDDAGVGAVTASSASNAWVFDNRGTESVNDTIALHWTGKGWAPTVRLAAYVQAAVTPSATGAWAFGAPASDPQGGYVAHFNGKTWSHASFPVDADSASALSAGDIWVGGTASDATSAPAIEHWNGKA